jgi:hypothetical protein
MSKYLEAVRTGLAERKTQASIARRLKISRERVRQIVELYELTDHVLAGKRANAIAQRGAVRRRALKRAALGAVIRKCREQGWTWRKIQVTLGVDPDDRNAWKKWQAMARRL